MKTQAKRKIVKSNLIIIAVAVLIGFTHQQCTRSVANGEQNKEQSAIPVKIANEQIRQLVQPLEVSGLVVASKEHRLSFKTGGIIDKILVKEGQSVRKGQLLATLKLNEIEAQVRQAHLGLDKASRDFDRIKNLYKDSVATLEQFQNVTTALELAKSNVEIAEYNRRFSKIEAPSDGIVLKKLNESNELVGPGQPVLVLASNDEEWQVKTGVTDKEVVHISLNDSAKVKIDAYPSETFSSVITQIGDAPDPMTGLYEVRMTINSLGIQLKPGFFANAEIIPNEIKAYVTIPIEAVTEGIGNTVTYYTLSPDKTKAIKKVAEVKWLQDNVVVLGTNVELPEAVIIESQKGLTDLAKVKIVGNSEDNLAK